MDVDYSPTGREFVAGGYDRSVRIFPYNGGHSREVYHTKRMQRVFATRFSGDASYVFSGSDDMNVRVWKVCFRFLLLSRQIWTAIRMTIRLVRRLLKRSDQILVCSSEPA